MNTSSSSASSLPHSLGHVLVVDDEPHVLAVAKAILEAHGYRISTAPSGEMAMAMCQQALSEGQRYAVVVLDLTMPGGLSGFEVLEMLRELDSSISVIACSGYFEENSRDICRSIGFADVLHKPYTLDLLCSTVRRCMTMSKPIAGHGLAAGSGGAAYEEVVA